MSRKRQQSSYTIFIACEGSVSEKEYFEAIRDEMLGSDMRIEIYPQDSQGKNDPLSLVQIAAKQLSTFKEVWAVFDKNGHPVADAFTAAKLTTGKSVNIAYSSIAFEHWILLHFEKNNTSFTKSDCKDKTFNKNFSCGNTPKPHPDDCKGLICIANRIREKYVKDYNKKGGYDLYGKIKHRNEHVIENAAWLRFMQGATIEAENYQAINPYTNLDSLFQKLTSRSAVICWGQFRQVYSNDDISISVDYQKPLITVSLTNKKNIGFVINNTNRNSFFYLSNDDLDTTSPQFVSEQISKNTSGNATKTKEGLLLYLNDTAEIKFNSVPSIKHPIYFNVKCNHVKYMFIL